MIPIAIIAAALIGFTPITHLDDAMQGRPISWDLLGLYPLDTRRKLDPEDLSEIELLRKGEGAEVRARSLARLRLRPDNIVAGWIYGQTARIGKNPDEALRLLESLKEKRAIGVDYAKLKCERIKLLSMSNPGVDRSALDYQIAVRSDAKSVWDHNPDAPELLPLYIDILEPDDARAILTDYAGRHKPDRIVKLLMVRAYLSGEDKAGTENRDAPWLARPILDELLKVNPNDAAANYYIATIDADSGKVKQAIGLFQWLIKNANLTDPMLEQAHAYLANPKATTLKPSPPEE